MSNSGALNRITSGYHRVEISGDKQKSRVPKNRQKVYGIISRKETVAKPRSQRIDKKAYGIISRKETGKITGAWNYRWVVRKLAKDEEIIL